MRAYVGALLILACAVGCSPTDDDEEGNGGQSSSSSPTPYGKLVLTSTSTAGASLTSESCQMFGDGLTRTDGTCITPTKVAGYVSEVSLGHQENDTQLRGSGRLFSADERTVSPGQILTGGEVDLSVQVKNLVGNNNLAGPTSNSTPSFRTAPIVTWSHVVASMHYLTYQFSAASKFITVLLPAFPQPYNAASNFTGCSPAPSSDELGQSRYTEASLLAGMSFQNGDYLFCVKDAQTDACAATDYQWYDLDTSALVSTRPTNPRQSTALKGAPTCNVGQGGGGGTTYDLALSLINIRANFASGNTFKLHGDYTHGEISEQWPGAETPFGESIPDGVQFYNPWVYYTYEPSGGTATSGGNLDVTLQFNVDGMVFVAMADISSATVEQIAANVYTRNTWIDDGIKAAGANSAGLESNLPIPTANVTIAVTGEKTAPTGFEVLFSQSGQTDHNPSQ